MESSDKMFLCLFFIEDRSLSVISKNDKNLSSNDYKEGSKCTMKWMGRKEYQCKILKVHDNKEFLDKWAAKVNNSILKRHADLDIDILVKEIQSFKEASNTGKRKRIETARSKESKIQNEEISPKKKKHVKDRKEEEINNTETDAPVNKEQKKQENMDEKKDERNKKVTTSKKSGEKVEKRKPSNEQAKKKAEESAAVSMSVEIVSEMASQFSMDSDTVISAPIEISKSTNNKNVLPICKTISPLRSTPGKQFSDMAGNQSSESATYLDMDLQHSHSIPLTETWNLCQRSDSEEFGMHFPSTHENFTQQTAKNGPQIPVPSPQVLETMKGIMHPEFQTYVREILNHFGHSEHQNNSFQQDVFGQTNYQYQGQEFNNYDNCEKNRCYNISPRRSPRLMKSSTSIASHQTPNPKGKSMAPKRSLLSTLSEEDENISSATVMSIGVISSEPSKVTHQSNVPQSSNHIETVKLLENSSIEVDKGNLKKASSLAKKHNNPGYSLCLKLVPLLFTDEELALSRGQGLTKAKPGDLRPCLNKEKVQVMKDYVQSWCKKHGFSVPSEAKLNDGVTERIAYSRKLLKRKSSNQ